MEHEPNSNHNHHQGPEPRLPAELPGQASEHQLRYFRCQALLANHVAAEEYKEAAEMAAEMGAIVDTQNKILVDRAIWEGREMLKEVQDSCKRSELQSLSFELDRATAEEDFAKAKEISRQISEIEGLGGSPEAGRTEGSEGVEGGEDVSIDGGWLEQELNFHVKKARMLEELHDRDPIQKYERDLRTAVRTEDYEGAAEARDGLKPLYWNRDLQRMQKMLQRQLDQEWAGLERLSEKPVDRLQYALTDAINAEEYELAAVIARRLNKEETALMLTSLDKQLAEKRDTKEEPSFAELQEALEGAIASEDFELASDIQELMRAADECFALEQDLETAAAAGDMQQQQELREQLVAKYTERLNKQLLWDMGFSVSPPEFRVGQVVHHKQGGFTGVVVGWHQEYEGDDSWMPKRGMEFGMTQRFYHVLPDARQVSMDEDTRGKQFIGDLGAPFLMGMADKISPRVMTVYSAEEHLQLVSRDDQLVSGGHPAKGPFGSHCPVEHYALPHLFKAFGDGEFKVGSAMGKLMFYKRQGRQTRLQSLHQERI